MIRVLIVDDSATTREMIRAILETDPQLEIAGEAANGMEGVTLAQELRPDVITMDVNMPLMNGFEATTTIMTTNPTPIVVVTTVSRQEMVHKGFDILLAGALEIVEKPSAMNHRDYRTVGEELIAKIKAVSQINLVRG